MGYLFRVFWISVYGLQGCRTEQSGVVIAQCYKHDRTNDRDIAQLTIIRDRHYIFGTR